MPDHLQPIPIPQSLDDKTQVETMIFAINDRLAALNSDAVGSGSSLAGALDVEHGLANDIPMGEGVYFEISVPQAASLTGFSGGYNNRQAFVKNVGSSNITLAHESSSSLEANRFKTRTGASVVMGANDIVQMIYSAKVGRWIVLTNLL